MSIKIPAKVENIDRAIEKLGGPEHLTDTLRALDKKVKRHLFEGGGRTQAHEIKNTLKFNLSDNVQVPLETKVPNQVLLKIVKLRSKRTG